jgi:hypothetical protein
VQVIFGSQVSVKVHPVVIFNILDHFIRRTEGQDRVIGTLLGVNVEGVIEIRNCFPVPHTEGEQVLFTSPTNMQLTYCLSIISHLCVDVPIIIDTNFIISLSSLFISCSLFHASILKLHSPNIFYAYANPIKVAVDMQFHRNMCDLHQRTAPKEVIVGW